MVLGQINMGGQDLAKKLRPVVAFLALYLQLHMRLVHIPREVSWYMYVQKKGESQTDRQTDRQHIFLLLLLLLFLLPLLPLTLFLFFFLLQISNATVYRVSVSHLASHNGRTEIDLGSHKCFVGAVHNSPDPALLDNPPIFTTPELDEERRQCEVDVHGLAYDKAAAKVSARAADQHTGESSSSRKRVLPKRRDDTDDEEFEEEHVEQEEPLALRASDKSLVENVSNSFKEMRVQDQAELNRAISTQKSKVFRYEPLSLSLSLF